MTNNNIVLIGRLTADVKVTKTQSGKSVASFNMAVNRSKEVTDFIRVTTWQQRADFLDQYSHKGDMIAIRGHIEMRQYEKDGIRQYATDIIADEVMILSHAEHHIDEGEKIYEELTKDAPSGRNSVSNAFFGTTIDDDSLPF